MMTSLKFNNLNYQIKHKRQKKTKNHLQLNVNRLLKTKQEELDHHQKQKWLFILKSLKMQLLKKGLTTQMLWMQIHWTIMSWCKLPLSISQLKLNFNLLHRNSIGLWLRLISILLNKTTTNSKQFKSKTKITAAKPFQSCRTLTPWADQAFKTLDRLMIKVINQTINLEANS